VSFVEFCGALETQNRLGQRVVGPKGATTMESKTWQVTFIDRKAFEEERWPGRWIWVSHVYLGSARMLRLGETVKVALSDVAADYEEYYVYQDGVQIERGKLRDYKYQ
jgi:hypothetical protein